MKKARLPRYSSRSRSFTNADLAPGTAALVERALALQADHPLSLLAQARLKCLAGASEEAKRLTRELLQKPWCEP